MPSPVSALPAVVADVSAMTPVPRGIRGHRTRARILRSAIELFAQHDYDAVSLRGITGPIRVNMSLVKFHFGRKEALYLEAVRLAGRVGLEEVRRLPPPPRPEDPDAAEGAARALEANIGMFITLGSAARHSASPTPERDIRSAALALLGRALGSPSPDTRQAIHDVLEAQHDHLEGCLRALRPDLDQESRFRIGTSIVGQGLLYFLFPTLVDRVRGSAEAGWGQNTLARQLAQFCLAGIRNFPPARPLEGEP